MKTLKNRKLLEIGLALCVLGGVAGGSFFAARHLLRGGAQAQLPSEEEVTQPALEFIAAAEAERTKPPFVGVFNGIRFAGPPNPDDRSNAPKTVCEVAFQENRLNPSTPSMASLIGTPFEITPSYLPPGAVEVFDPTVAGVIACDGQISMAKRWWNFPDTGGHIGVTKVGGERAVEGRVSVDRLQAITIDGKPAVAILPLTAQGGGPGGIIIAEDFGITVVGGVEFPIEVYIAVAEGLK